MPEPKAILLDFYGTVVEEDEAPVSLACSEIVKSSSRALKLEELTSFWWNTFGDLCANSYGDTFQYEKELGQESLRRAIRHFKVDTDSERITQLLSRYWDEYWGKPSIFPESRGVIVRIKDRGTPICLVSNIDNAVLDSALKYNGLSFDMIVTSEDCRSYKPRYEMFQKALSLLSLSNDEVLHVGDSLRADVRGAKCMKIPVLWINRKNGLIPQQSEQPDFIATDLTGIIKFFGW